MVGIVRIFRPRIQCGFDDVDDVIVGAHSHDVSIESRHGRHDAIGAQRHDDEQIQKFLVAFSQKQTDENGTLTAVTAKTS